MIDLKKKYKTVSGKTVNLISTLGLGSFPVVGQLENNSGDWCTACWDHAGQSPTGSNDDALVAQPDEVQAYFNVFRYKGGSDKSLRIGERANEDVAAAKNFRGTTREYFGVVRLTTKGTELVSAEVACND